MNSPRYLVFAGAFLAMTAWMLRAFLPGVVWGAVFTISLWPAYRQLVQRAGPRLPAPALLFTLAFALLILAPMAYVGFEFTRLYSAGSDWLAQGTDGGLPAPAVLGQLPFGDRLLELWQEYLGRSDALLQGLSRLGSARLASWVSAAAVQLSSDLLSTLAMLVSFYFMLRHGSAIEAHSPALLNQWLTAKGAHVMDRGVLALRGTINGVVLIGLLEGILLAIPLVLAGIHAGLLIGLAAGIVGVIPLVMPLLILPCAAWLWFSGSQLFAVLTTIDLVVVWLVFENIIKPGIISSAVKVNPWLVLVGLIGGLQVLGPVGLFLGPALVAMSTGMARDLLTPA